MLLTPKQNAILHVAQSAAIFGIAVYAFLTNKISATLFASVVGPLGGAWVGVGGAVTLLGNKSVPSASSVPVPVTAAPSTSVTAEHAANQSYVGGATSVVAQVPFVAPSATALGPEHGAPTTA